MRKRRIEAAPEDDGMQRSGGETSNGGRDGGEGQSGRDKSSAPELEICFSPTMAKTRKGKKENTISLLERTASSPLLLERSTCLLACI